MRFVAPTCARAMRRSMGFSKPKCRLCCSTKRSTSYRGREGKEPKKTHQKTITRSFPNSYFTKSWAFFFRRFITFQSSGQHHDSHPSKNWPELLLHSRPTVVISKENTSGLQQVEVQREFLGTEVNWASTMDKHSVTQKTLGTAR